MIFPEVKSESWRKRATDAIKGVAKGVGGALKGAWKRLFKGQPDKSDVDNIVDKIIMTPLSHSEGQQMSLGFYLASHEEKLKGLDFSKVNFNKLVNNIYHIYEQLYTQKVCCDNRKEDRDWMAPGVAMVWCVSIVLVHVWLFVLFCLFCCYRG